MSEDLRSILKINSITYTVVFVALVIYSDINKGIIAALIKGVSVGIFIYVLSEFANMLIEAYVDKRNVIGNIKEYINKHIMKIHKKKILERGDKDISEI